MRVCFWQSDKPREHLLADAFADGVRALGLGDTVEQRPLLAEPELADCDVAVMVGVKSRELFHMHWKAGIHVVMIDKGYSRHAAKSPVKLWEYWRVAVDAHHPTARLMDMARPPDRFDALGIKVRPWRRAIPAGHILIAGSSAKYHDFYGLKDPTRWTEKVVANLRQYTSRPIVYRPKPSWREAVPVKGTRYSELPETIDQALAGAHACVTHGSNAVFEAVVAGVPCIVLGAAVAEPISSHTLEEIENPRLADDAERRQWLANIAYCQWTLPEFAAGDAWRVLRPQIYG